MRNEAVRAAKKTAGSILTGALIGLVFLALGIAMLVYNDHYAKTTATVTQASGGKATVTYTVKGQQYTGTWDKGVYQVGDKVKVYYNTKNPTSLSSEGNDNMDLICIAAGVLALAVTGLLAVKGAQVQRRRQTMEPFPPITLLPKEQMDLYRVSNDGKMLKQGYMAWDSDGSLVYEWHPVKYVPFKGRTVVFTNHRTGRTSEHVWNAGGGIETSTNTGRKISVGFGTIQQRRTTSSIRWCSLDGRDLWDVLQEKGIHIRTQMEMENIPKVIFTVAKDGCHFATIEIGGDEHMQELLAQGAGGGLHYKCWTAEDDLDTLFLIVFILEATENNLPE